MNRDITIIYQGGAGGFCLFYYLLLSGKYHAGLEDENIQTLIDKQFPRTLIDRPTEWKNTEFWPNNKKCKESSATPKLFLICNPTKIPHQDDDHCITKDTYKILLYTSFKLQMRMNWEKKAYWFFWYGRETFNAPEKDYQYIRQLYRMSENGFDPVLKDIQYDYEIDQKVRLEDLIKNKTIDNFGPPNQHQLEFLEHWYNLQPNKAKRLLTNY